MSKELRLWAVHGAASFTTVAWAVSAEDAVDAVPISEYEEKWDTWAREIPIERAVLVTGDLHDTKPDDELWHFEDDDHPDPPTLAQAIEILRERHAANQRAEAERNNGQIALPLDGDTVSQDVSFIS
jgi:hypothetical protein